MSILTVGAGQSYATLAGAVAASSAGDTIQVQAGDYVDDFTTIGHTLTIQSVGGLARFIAASPPPDGKAIMTVDADLTLSGLAFTGAAVPDGNGAGIRYEAGNLSISHSLFWGNQDGLLGAANPTGTISIDGSEFAFNGTGDGFTHNLYVGEIASLVVTDSYFHDVSVGHEIKSRALSNTITGNTIADGPDSTGSYAIDLPNGGTGIITGNLFQKGPNTENQNFVSVGEEGGVYPGTQVAVSGNVFIDEMPPAVPGQVVRNVSGGPVQVTGNTLYGFDPAGFQFGATEVSDNTLNPLPGPPIVPVARLLAVPEPNMVPMLLLLAAAAAGWRRRQPRRRAARRAAHAQDVSQKR